MIALAWIAWNGIAVLGSLLQDKVADLSQETHNVIGQVSDLAVDNSIRALDVKSRENIERLTTDTARAVADFLYDRDDDIRMAAELEPSVENYRRFLAPMKRTVIGHKPWKMNSAGDAWIPADDNERKQFVVKANNPDNAKDFHYRQPENPGVPEDRPLYHEMTFVDLNGNEVVKVSTSDLLDKTRRNIADSKNTYCKAETYFPALSKLGNNDVYVSEVIGPYLRSPIIGAYTEKRAKEKGLEFKPEDAAYAGKENPVGKRFQGIVRWAAPVMRKGKKIGWVTLALDHTHIMEFTDHLVPTDERYSPISNAGSGNYAFMWDYKDRNISHPRDYFIVGYDPNTGQPAVPWLEQNHYNDYMQSGLSVMEWEEAAPIFQNQSLKKKPATTLTKEGLLGLDCRYLDFAPQCEGWRNLTLSGGSGSFVIFWSGLWKLTTAAAIPYHTGIYKDPRGFGFITIGANVHEFHRAATETGEKISNMASNFEARLKEHSDETQRNLATYLNKTTREISISTALMAIFVVFIAIWMASTLTRKITGMIKGIRLFQDGDMDHRLQVDSRDEMGQLAEAFNDMSDDMQSLITDLIRAEENYRGFFENATEGIFRSRADGKLINVNPAFATLFGFASPEEMLSKVTHIGEELYVDPERRQELLRMLDEQRMVRDFEYEIRRPDGTTRFLRASCHWVTDPDGQQYLEGMSTDITERKLAIQALEKAKEEAEQLSSMKSNFLSMVSHELRTPLTSIIGFTKLIRKNLGMFKDREQVQNSKSLKLLNRMDDNTQVIITEGDRLSELINNVLDLAKLEAGYFVWDFKPVSIEDILVQSMVATRVLFDRKGLALERDIAHDLPEISGDHDRLVQVCINLLSNASKFTEEGRILCQASVEGLDVVVRVTDTGVGVPDDEVDVIFDKFRQLGNTLTDKPKGTGLGLPISREIVEYHGGRIWHESAEGGGSVFAFSLPLNCHID